jgi:membrane dipeptidase
VNAQDDTVLEQARRLLDDTILIDGHNDLPWAIRTAEAAPRDVEAYDLSQPAPGDTDIARLREGRVGAQFWSVYVPAEDASAGYARLQLEQIDIARRVIARYPKQLGLALSAEEIESERAAGRIASLLGIEGGHAIENSLGALRSYYGLGVRYMTLTHGATLDWADSATDVQRHGGLTRFGEEVVREMNRLGMLVDLSHVSDEAAEDALRVSEAPVIFSHSSARAICDHPRNVPDSILRKLSAKGGVIMVTFVASFISPDIAEITQPLWTEYTQRSKGIEDEDQRTRLNEELFAGLELPEASIAQVADHIEHIRDVAGVDHIGLGGDYDGATRWPVGLEDVSGYPLLFAELLRRGWSEADLRKLAGENLLRALRQAEATAQRLQASRPASTATIEDLDRHPE